MPNDTLKLLCETVENCPISVEVMNEIEEEEYFSIESRRYRVSDDEPSESDIDLVKRAGLYLEERYPRKEFNYTMTWDNIDEWARIVVRMK